MSECICVKASGLSFETELKDIRDPNCSYPHNDPCAACGMIGEHDERCPVLIEELVEYAEAELGG